MLEMNKANLKKNRRRVFDDIYVHHFSYDLNFKTLSLSRRVLYSRRAI